MRYVLPDIKQESPIPLKSKINILKLYITPILTYAEAAWALFIGSSQWRRIEAIQAMTLCLITGNLKYVRNEVRLKLLSCESIKSFI